MGEEDGYHRWEEKSYDSKKKEDNSRGCSPKAKDTEAKGLRFSVPDLLSSSLDAVVMKVKGTKGAFHDKGSLGAVSTSDPISELNSFSTRFLDSLLFLPDREYPTVMDNTLEVVGIKDKVREKNRRRKQVVSLTQPL